MEIRIIIQSPEGSFVEWIFLEFDFDPYCFHPLRINDGKLYYSIHNPVQSTKNSWVYNKCNNSHQYKCFLIFLSIINLDLHLLHKNVLLLFNLLYVLSNLRFSFEVKFFSISIY